MAGRQNVAWYEADQFFIDDASGKYVFQPTLIGQAHSWCQLQTSDSLSYKMDVIVSNTFTTAKEIRPYLHIAKEHALPRPAIYLCQSSFGSVHGVPDQTLAAMKKRFLYDLEPLMAEYGY
jgi:hypothetical protein